MFQSGPLSAQPVESPTRRSYTITPELSTRFDEFLRYARQFRNVSVATTKWYSETFATFRKFLASRDVDAIDENVGSLIIDWIASSRERVNRPISPFTARSYWQALRSFFVYLEEFDGFANPFTRLKAPRVPTDPFPKALTHEQCVRVLDAVHNTRWADGYERARAAAMLGVALYAGLRRKEILELRFLDVNLEEQWIRICHGKGDKARTSYIAPELDALLRTYLNERRRAHLESVEFFTSRHSGAGVKVKTFSRIVERTRTTAGFRFSVHMLRHSFVTMLARNHAAPHLIRELAGHRDLKTTQRYTRMFAEDMLAEVGRLTFRRSDAKSE
jgi:site-specific recombinase XerD